MMMRNFCHILCQDSTMEFLGKQYFIELYNCDTSLLDDPEFIGKHMVQAAKEANATVVQQFFHQFSPFGVSGTVVIAESHINIHTWPEHGYAAIDMFTCGESLEADKGIEYLAKWLKAKSKEVRCINRGALKSIYEVKEGA